MVVRWSAAAYIAGRCQPPSSLWFIFLFFSSSIPPPLLPRAVSAAYLLYGASPFKRTNCQLHLLRSAIGVVGRRTCNFLQLRQTRDYLLKSRSVACRPQPKCSSRVCFPLSRGPIKFVRHSSELRLVMFFREGGWVVAAVIVSAAAAASIIRRQHQQ
jgi:hypothetical protein